MHRRTHRIRHVLVAVVTIVAGLTFVTGVGPAAADDDDWGPSVPGEFIVELLPGANAAAVNAAVGGIAAPERLASTSQLYRFRLPGATDPAAGVDRIKNTDGVVQAQPNVKADLPEYFGGRRYFWTDHEPPAAAPASAFAVTQPALGNAGLPARGATGQGVVVAVLDTGIDATHPALAGRIAGGGYDFVDRDATPAEVTNSVDENANGVVDEAFGHGTYVAGIVQMVAPGARILPIRIIDTDGQTTAWRILQGVNRATGRARVVNLSLGGLNLGKIVEQQLEARANSGMVLVAAAGNENTTDLRYPAANPGVVGVTAINGTTGQKATFANSGSWIDVAAPGVRVVSTFLGGGYATWGGTSASAPVVTGALALVAGVMGPGAQSTDVIDRLTATANGDGLPNVSAYGRVDVNAAVVNAQLG
jgi:subtilisin family serine protease